MIRMTRNELLARLNMVLESENGFRNEDEKPYRFVFVTAYGIVKSTVVSPQITKDCDFLAPGGFHASIPMEEAEKAISPVEDYIYCEDVDIILDHQTTVHMEFLILPLNGLLGFSYGQD